MSFLGFKVMRRSSALLAAVAVAAMALAPSLADARAGGGASMGSRGSRTYSAPPSTSTAPSYSAPMERSITPRSAPSAPGYAPAPNFAPQRSSGFLSGLAGGLLGVGLGGLLFGHGFMGNGSGFGFIGFLLQALLLFFVARWVFRRVFGRGPAFAGPTPRMGQPAPQAMNFNAAAAAGGAAAQPVAIGPADYAAFEQVLHNVQDTWSRGDLGAMQALATPEMVSYFNEQLSTLASRGVRNTVTEVRLEKGDLAEAWREHGQDYATVAMRFSMLDVTRDQGGRVVDGDPTTRTVATELWTFVRAAGGRWLLSAIQQAR